MTAATALEALTDHVGTLAVTLQGLARRVQELEAKMATQAQFETAIARLEAAIGGLVQTVGVTVTELENRAQNAEIPDTLLSRVDTATQTVAQLEDQVRGHQDVTPPLPPQYRR